MKNDKGGKMENGCVGESGRQKVHRRCPDIMAMSSRDSVTITISGLAFENVRELTKIFNAWDKNHLTPAGYVLEHFLEGDWWDLLDVKKPNRFFQSTAGMLVAQYDRCDDIGELKTALESAGFGISY